MARKTELFAGGSKNCPFMGSNKRRTNQELMCDDDVHEKANKNTLIF